MIALRLAFSMTLLLGGLFGPLTVEATVHRIGYLELNRTDTNPRLLRAFHERTAQPWLR
jgi:hypothetical protein